MYVYVCVCVCVCFSCVAVSPLHWQTPSSDEGVDDDDDDVLTQREFTDCLARWKPYDASDAERVVVRNGNVDTNLVAYYFSREVSVQLNGPLRFP